MEQDLYNIWIDYIKDQATLAKLSPKQQSHLQTNKDNYLIIEDHLYYRKSSKERPRRVITEDKKEIILKALHQDEYSGHLGRKITVNKVRERYYWPGYRKDIEDYIRTCQICQQRGRPKKTEPLNPIKVDRPFDRIGIDIVGPLPMTTNRNQYIVVAMDYLTKWPEARALKKS